MSTTRWATLLWLLLAASGAAAAEDPKLTVQLGPEVTGPATPIALAFDQRLTVVLPDKVRLAVAGSTDVLVVHVNDNVVVASLVDSEYVRAATPRTNLTVLTEAGVAFTCVIEVAAAGKPAAINLIEVKAAPGRQAQVSAEAVALVRTWLLTPGALDPETASVFKTLEPDIQRRARRELASWVGRRGFEALADVQRTRQNFIYLTSHGLARVGDEVLIRLSATNHSQPALTIGRVQVFADGSEIPAESLVVALPDPALPADGAPRPIGVLVPASQLRETLEAQICEDAAEPRCVRLALR